MLLYLELPVASGVYRLCKCRPPDCDAGTGALAFRPASAGSRWHDLKFGKEAARQTMLHLVLLTGSILFLVPFAWLVVTSLKESRR